MCPSNFKHVDINEQTEGLNNNLCLISGIDSFRLLKSQ